MVAAEHARPIAEVEEDYGGAGSDGADNLLCSNNVNSWLYVIYDCYYRIVQVQFSTGSLVSTSDILSLL